jgi:hypothetical protein
MVNSFFIHLFYLRYYKMTVGVVYRLYADNTDKCYVGSTTSKYPSVRLAHHRHAHKNGMKDYQGLFDEGCPKMEILEKVEYGTDKSVLRCCELKWLTHHLEHAINQRIPYASYDHEKSQRDARIKRYHQSEKGKIAIEKAKLNQQVKKEQNPFKLMSMNDRIKYLTEQQHTLRKKHGYRQKEILCLTLQKNNEPKHLTFE